MTQKNAVTPPKINFVLNSAPNPLKSLQIHGIFLKVGPSNGVLYGKAGSCLTNARSQEKLGYKVELKGPGSLTRDGFFALTGCTSPSGLDPGCGPSGPSITYTHINIEVWTDVYRGSWDEIQMKYPNMAPKNLGNLGYYGATGLYVPSAVQERAYEAEGSNLDFYRDYNVTWKNPSRYFTSPGDVNVSELLPCIDSALMLHEAGVPKGNLEQQAYLMHFNAMFVKSRHQTMQKMHSLCSINKFGCFH